MDRLKVECLAGDLQSPQVRLQPGGGIEDVGGGFVQPGGQRPPHVKFVGSPVNGERGVEAVRHQFGCPGAFGARHGLVREPDGAFRMAGVRPAPGERGGQPRPGRVVGCARQHVVQLGWQLAGRGPEHVDRRRAEHRLGPPVEVVSFPAERGRLVVKARGVRSPAGHAGGVGAAEKIADGRRVRRHASS